MCRSESGRAVVSKRDSVSALSSPPAITNDVVSDRWANSSDLTLLEWIWYRLSHEMIAGSVGPEIEIGCLRDSDADEVCS